VNRTEKEAFVADFRGRLARARFVVVTEFIGLTVEGVNDLRGRLRKANVELCVVKNNLVRLAGKDTPFDQLGELFVGPNAVVLSYGDDPVEPTKALLAFAKDHPQLALKAALLDGKFLDRGGIETLSNLPDKNTMRAHLLGVLKAPARQTVSLFAAVPRSLLYALKAREEQVGKAA
jgi:large subunit ribosomal protein L10